jgi:Na+-driven multidrug efflux pump
MVLQWMVQFPLAYVLSKHTMIQADGVWWSFPANTVVVAIIAVCWFLRGSWKNTRLTDEDKLVVAATQEAIIDKPMR